MTRLEIVENQVKELSAEELRAFREWFANYSANDPVDDIVSRYPNTLRALSK
ncbi:MAG: hypothetical protein ACLPWF_04905 [Bryobacteraceae bacterium]